jgi:hypothetical protein
MKTISRIPGGTMTIIRFCVLFVSAWVLAGGGCVAGIAISGRPPPRPGYDCWQKLKDNTYFNICEGGDSEKARGCISECFSHYVKCANSFDSSIQEYQSDNLTRKSFILNCDKKWSVCIDECDSSLSEKCKEGEQWSQHPRTNQYILCE